LERKGPTLTREGGRGVAGKESSNKDEKIERNTRAGDAPLLGEESWEKGFEGKGGSRGMKNTPPDFLNLRLRKTSRQGGGGKKNGGSRGGKNFKVSRESHCVSKETRKCTKKKKRYKNS